MRKLGACRWGRKRVKWGGKKIRRGRKKENVHVLLYLDLLGLAVVSWRPGLFLKRKQSGEGIWGETERNGRRGSCGLEVLYERKKYFQ